VVWGFGKYVLSAREETALLGHLVAVFAVGAQAEEDSSDGEDGKAHDGSVGFPVLGLRVPTTSGGPDVLGVAMES